MPRRPEPSDYYAGGTVTGQTPAEPQAQYEMTDRDRGAIAALRLLLRANEVHEGEEEMTTTADDIANAIERKGLAATVRFQMDAETDYLMDEEATDDYDPFPPDLAAIASEAPHTVWNKP